MAKLAIRGGTPISRKAPLCPWPIADARDEKMLLQALRSPAGWCRLGVKEGTAERFERQFARYHDAKYCLALANGTVAIETVLKAVGLKPGDEVIVPSITFIATASGVLMARGLPVFADAIPDTCQIDPADVERKITSRTRGLVVVHYAGYPVDMDAIVTIARRHDLFLVEDCAHAQGTAWRGRKVGAFGAGGTFSFQGSKSLTCGEGGALVTDELGIYEAAWAYHHIGRGLKGGNYAFTSIGPNYRLGELAAAVLCTQLEKFPAQARTRARNAARIARDIAEIPGLLPLKRDERITQRGYYFYVLRYLEGHWGVPREAFVKAFHAESGGLPVGTGYGMPVYRTPAFATNRFDVVGSEIHGRPAYGRVMNYRAVRCPNAERIAYREQLTFAQRVLLHADACELVVEIIRKLWENRGELQRA
jgi:dTDP-4-amino-4,6-dideoxygalactose transaminase